MLAELDEFLDNERNDTRATGRIQIGECENCGADNKYSVTRCDPAVEGVGALAEKLNTNNDFSAFVRLMRAAFQRGLEEGEF